jgi:hypothetical protein
MPCQLAPKALGTTLDSHILKNRWKSQPVRHQRTPSLEERARAGARARRVRLDGSTRPRRLDRRSVDHACQPPAHFGQPHSETDAGRQTARNLRLRPRNPPHPPPECGCPSYGRFCTGEFTDETVHRLFLAVGESGGGGAGAREAPNVHRSSRMWLSKVASPGHLERCSATARQL